MGAGASTSKPTGYNNGTKDPGTVVTPFQDTSILLHLVKDVNNSERGEDKQMYVFFKGKTFKFNRPGFYHALRDIPKGALCKMQVKIPNISGWEYKGATTVAKVKMPKELCPMNFFAFRVGASDSRSNAGLG